MLRQSMISCLAILMLLSLNMGSVGSMNMPGITPTSFADGETVSATLDLPTQSNSRASNIFFSRLQRRLVPPLRLVLRLVRLILHSFHPNLASYRLIVNLSRLFTFCSSSRFVLRLFSPLSPRLFYISFFLSHLVSSHASLVSTHLILLSSRLV
jgi:hypothetical protein